jgi:hypothetical protein
MKSFIKKLLREGLITEMQYTDLSKTIFSLVKYNVGRWKSEKQKNYFINFFENWADGSLIEDNGWIRFGSNEVYGNTTVFYLKLDQGGINIVKSVASKSKKERILFQYNQETEGDRRKEIALNQMLKELRTLVDEKSKDPVIKEYELKMEEFIDLFIDKILLELHDLYREDTESRIKLTLLRYDYLYKLSQTKQTTDNDNFYKTLIKFIENPDNIEGYSTNRETQHYTYDIVKSHLEQLKNLDVREFLNNYTKNIMDSIYSIIESLGKTEEFNNIIKPNMYLI